INKGVKSYYIVPVLPWRKQTIPQITPFLVSDRGGREELAVYRSLDEHSAHALPRMLHARRQIIWIEDTTTLMPVQAAHNLAAMHYARDSRLKLQSNGGKYPDGFDSDGGKEVKELSKWSTAHPMASVSSVLMQSVEPLEDFATGVTELLPNPTAPSAAEVRLVLARRRMLDRERAQHAQNSTGNDTSSQVHQEQPQIPSVGGQGVVNQSNDNGMLTPNALVDKPRTKTVEFEDRAGKKLSQGTADTTGCQGVAESSPARDSSTAATTPPPVELVQEDAQDSRLVLPVLESLIALRRSRLTRPTQPAQQPPQSPHPPARPSNMSTNGGSCGGGTAAGDAASWYGSSGAPSPSAAVKSTGAKTTRRFGMNTANTNANASGAAAAAAAAAPPQLRLQSDLTVAQADGVSAAAAAAATPPASAAVGSNRPQMMLSGPPMMQPPTLSQFPGPFRSTRRWEVFLPDGPCGAPVSGVMGGGLVTPSGASFSATTRATGATATAATGSSGRACGVSWAGNEASLDRVTVAVGSSLHGSKLSAAASTAAAATGAAAATPAAMFSSMGQMAVTATGRSSDASTSVCPTSRVSPRTSIELGLASSTDGGPDDSGGMPRSIDRQRALLQEWHEWRERGSLGPPPGIDEETDCSGDGVAAAAVASVGKNMDDDEEEGANDDDDGCELLLGLSSGRRLAGKLAAGPAAAAAAAAAVGHDDDDDGYDESPEVGQEVWGRSRRITQSFDLLELEGLSVPASMAKTSMSAPLGLVLSPTSPAGPPPPTILSGISSPSAAPSMSAAQGLGAAVPLSPMASRRRGDNTNGARPGVGPLALPMWLNRALGATTAVAPMPVPMSVSVSVPADEAIPCEDGGGHGSAPSAPAPATAAAASAASAVATSSRIPSLANAKHLSFTSKFNRFRERIQSFSMVHPAPAIEVSVTERAQSMMGGGAAGPKIRVAVSNDGRNTLTTTPLGPGHGAPELFQQQQQQQQQQQPMVRQTQSRKGLPGAGTGASTDLSIRPAGRGSTDATASRVSNRHSLDSRVSNSKGRNPTVESLMPMSPGGAVGGGVGQQPQQQGFHEAFVLTNSVDRSRRGDPSVHQVPGLLPPVRLL
ncbi:hypothetical protein Vafri_13133, partial [Volvox africanus]